MSLREYLFSNRYTVKDFANEIGYTRQRISQIVNGAPCSKRMAFMIEKYTKGAVKASALEKQGRKNGWISVGYKLLPTKLVNTSDD